MLECFTIGCTYIIPFAITMAKYHVGEKIGLKGEEKRKENAYVPLTCKKYS